MDENYVCKIASLEEMNRRWDDEISRHREKGNWIVWKEEAVGNFLAGRSFPYYGILNGTVICEATASLDPGGTRRGGWTAGKGAAELCAFRTVREYRGMGYFSRLKDFMLEDLKRKGFTAAFVGVEPHETLNKAIYSHWGFTDYLGSGTETYPDGTVIRVEYYGKRL